MANEINIETREDWNQGEFDNTSADRDNESGNLGIGYVNGDFDSNRTNQPLENLIGFWRLDNGEAKDFSAQNYDGNVDGTVPIVDGPLATDGMAFDSGGSVSISDVLGDNVSDINNAIVLALWLKLDTADTPEIIDIDTNTEDTFLIQPNRGEDGDSDDGNIRLRVRDGSSDVNQNEMVIDTTDTRNLDDGNWHLVIFNIDTDVSEDIEGDIYVDGEKKDTVITRAGSPSGFQDGFDFSGTDFLIGDAEDDYSIADVMLFAGSMITEGDAEALFFNGHEDDNFEGDYKTEIFEPEEGDNVTPTGLTLDIDKDTNSSGEVAVELLDANDNVIETDTIEASELVDGEETYNLDFTESGPKIRFKSVHEVDIS